MLLELTHDTVFNYSAPVNEAYMEFRLTPLMDGMQHLLQHRQRVKPARPVRQYVDAFGNTVSYFSLISAHDQITVSFDSIVETYPSPVTEASPPVTSLDSPEARLLLHDYLGPTSLTEWCPELDEFVRPLESLRGAPSRELARAVYQEIRAHFRYEGEVTNAESPITDILRERAGVCQDFAHLMIASCRRLGGACRYVSGYVLPVDGQEASASHAWCEVFDPHTGWFGMDPTHAEEVDERYVRLGVGRDYKDVPPNRGVLRGQATEKMQIHVHLRPINRDELAQKVRALYPLPRPREHPGTRPGRPAPVSILEQALSSQQQQQQQ
jgi:transglutaminase-like putative cysteine protease